MSRAFGFRRSAPGLEDGYQDDSDDHQSDFDWRVSRSCADPNLPHQVSANQCGGPGEVAYTVFCDLQQFVLHCAFSTDDIQCCLCSAALHMSGCIAKLHSIPIPGPM